MTARLAKRRCSTVRSMSVELRFRPDPREASAARATDDAGLFEETALIVPVRFTVNGHDILPIRRTPAIVWIVDPGGTAAPSEPIELDSWPQQPLVGFLVGLRKAIAVAQRSGHSTCWLAGARDLTFTLMPRSRLAVTDPSGAVTERALVREFADAIARFETDARSWLQEDAPHLTAHPSWSDWFLDAKP